MNRIEHLQEKLPGLANYIIGTTLAATIIAVLLLGCALYREYTKKRARRQERREKRMMEKRKGRA